MRQTDIPPKPTADLVPGRHEVELSEITASVLGGVALRAAIDPGFKVEDDVG